MDRLPVSNLFTLGLLILQHRGFGKLFLSSMEAGNNGSHHFRKALLGALKDSTKVGLAKVNSENKVGLFF